MHKFKTCGLQNFCKVICNYLPKKPFFSEPFQTIYRTIRCSSSNKIPQKLFVPDTCRPDIRRCIAPPVFWLWWLLSSTCDIQQFPHRDCHSILMLCHLKSVMWLVYPDYFILPQPMSSTACVAPGMLKTASAVYVLKNSNASALVSNGMATIEIVIC